MSSPPAKRANVENVQEVKNEGESTTSESRSEPQARAADDVRTIKLPANEIEKRKVKKTLEYFPRSCDPDCEVTPTIDATGTVQCDIRAMRDIEPFAIIHLPFDEDYYKEEEPLECLRHLNNIDDCEYEIRRKEYQANQQK